MIQVQACGEEILHGLHEELLRLEEMSVWPVSAGAITPLQGPIGRMRKRILELEQDIRNREDLYREDRYLLAAAMDGVAGVQLKLLRRARRELSPVEPRPFLTNDLTKELGVTEKTIWKHLGHLVRLGYLERATDRSDEHLGRSNPYAYRLGSPASRAA